ANGPGRALLERSLQQKHAAAAEAIMRLHETGPLAVAPAAVCRLPDDHRMEEFLLAHALVLLAGGRLGAEPCELERVLLARGPEQPPSRGAGLQSVRALHDESSRALSWREAHETARRVTGIAESIQDEARFPGSLPAASREGLAADFASKHCAFRCLEQCS